MYQTKFPYIFHGSKLVQLRYLLGWKQESNNEFNCHAAQIGLLVCFGHIRSISGDFYAQSGFTFYLADHAYAIHL